MQKKEILVLSGEKDLNWIQAYKAFSLGMETFSSSTPGLNFINVQRATFTYVHCAVLKF
jgi:hypothetical protein